MENSIFHIEGAGKNKKVVAASLINKGTRICTFTGKKIDYKETLELGDQESFAFQVACNSYIYLDPPARYFNHSCEPNCGVKPGLGLVALRNIGVGEELRWDYSTSMLEHHWTMRCLCNAPSCRHIIGDFTTLSPALQQHYTRMNIVQPFILKYINKKRQEAKRNDL